MCRPIVLLLAILCCHLFGCTVGSGNVLDSTATTVSCGVVGRKGALGCQQPVQTDCGSIIELPRLCPSECPFVAPHPYLNCVFQCTNPLDCSNANAELAYPNNATFLCESCEIVGCKRCSSHNRCAECFDDFVLSFGGRVCVYVWDLRAQSGVKAAVAFIAIAALLVFVTLTICDYCSCVGHCLPQETPDMEQEVESQGEDTDEIEDCEAYNHMPPTSPKAGEGQGLLRSTSGEELSETQAIDAVSLGLRHRRRCKVRQLEALKDPSKDKKKARIPFWIDLQSKFLVGVGLPLFHQWYYFFFIYSVLMCCGSAWIFYGSKLSDALQRTGLEEVSHELLGAQSRSLCSLQSSRDFIGEAVQDYAQRAARGYLALFAVNFFLLLGFAYRQKKVAEAFYRNHQCLAEFVLNVEGFPPDAVDEAQVRSFLQDAMGNSDLEVSICYDFREIKPRVRELLEKVIVAQDVKRDTYSHNLADPDTMNGGYGLTPADKEEIRAWVEKDKEQNASSRLKNSGSVFVIFSHIYDLTRCKERFAEDPRHYTESTSSSSYGQAMLPHAITPEWLPAMPLKWIGSDNKSYALKLRDVLCEPTDVVWDNQGSDQKNWCSWRMLGAIIVMFGSFGGMVLLVFFPLGVYIVHYVFQAGGTPTGIMMSLLGILVMWANWILCLVQIKVSNWIGFVRRDREGLLIFKAFAVLCLASFLINVAYNIFPARSTDLFRSFGEGEAVASMQDISLEGRIALHLFHVLVPGGLFFGYLIFPLQGFVWPLVSNLSLLKFLHRKGIGNPLMAREAELALEPLGMSLGHDYMGHFVQPISCSLVLFFASGVAWQMFGFMAIWSVFMIPFQRYLHLRCAKRIYVTTNRIDCDLLCAWGIPLSMVLAASYIWAARLYRWPLWAVLPIMFLANVVYLSILLYCIQPMTFAKDFGQSSRQSYDEVRLQRFYDWHNCNPIKVLLSHSIESTVPIVPFEVGKEYLVAQDAEYKTRETKVKRQLWQQQSVSQELTNQYSALGSWLSGIHVPEMETILQAPLSLMNHITSRCCPQPEASGTHGTPSPGRAHSSPAVRQKNKGPADISRAKSTAAVERTASPSRSSSP